MELASRWPLPEALDVRDELIEAYADPARSYHDQRHLVEVLDRLDELAGHTSFDQRAVVLAAWFHDGVYDGQPDAEERSSRWAEAALAHAGISPQTVAEVVRLVRLTEHHRPDANDVNGGVLSDADLAILASSPDRYGEYVADVRGEYPHVSDRAFAQGRAQVLRALLAKPTLFHTAYARTGWERSGQANLTRELALLDPAFPDLG